jgi:hypothetical protein
MNGKDNRTEPQIFISTLQLIPHIKLWKHRGSSDSAATGHRLDNCHSITDVRTTMKITVFRYMTSEILTKCCYVTYAHLLNYTTLCATTQEPKHRTASSWDLKYLACIYDIFRIIHFFAMVQQTPIGPGPKSHSKSHSDTPHWVGLLCTNDQPDADLCLTTHNTHKRRASMPLAGFETPIPVSERTQTHAFARAATEIGWNNTIRTHKHIQDNVTELKIS